MDPLAYKTDLGCQIDHRKPIFIDFTNMGKRKCINYMNSHEFPWFRGYEKGVKRCLESIYPEIVE